jgi:hypothetical protein
MSTGLPSPLASIAVRVDGAIRPVDGAYRPVAPVAGSRLDGVPIGPASDLFSGRSFEEHPIEEPPSRRPERSGRGDGPAGHPRTRPPALMSRLEGCFRVGLNTALSADFRPGSDPDLRRSVDRRFYRRFRPDPRGVCSLARCVWCYTFSVMRGGLSGADRRGTSRRDSGPGGDRAMPASACCLALSAEALRRLCEGVPIGGRPMLGRAAHAQESRLRSPEPLMLVRAAYVRQHRLHHGGAAHAGLRPSPSVVRACRPGPVPRNVFPGASHPIGGYLQPGRLEERRGQGGPRRPPALTSTGLPSPTSPRWRVPSTGR